MPALPFSSVSPSMPTSNYSSEVNEVSITSYSAIELYDSIESKDDVIYLDVRNEENHQLFMVEGPNDVEMYNIPYFDFMEDPEGCTAKLPEGRPVKVICAKEGSAQFVADILDSQGREEVSWLEGGIVTWGNLLIPKRINSADEDYEIWQFNRPGKASCSYGLIHGEQMMLFDASRAVEFYVEFAASRGADIRHVLETHLQADYISGSPRIAAATGAEFHAHDGDYAVSVFDYTSIVDGELIHFKRDGGPSVLCTHAPGHTPGSTAYVVDEKYLISGDTVFIVSVGRPDLGKRVVEWAKQLYATLKQRITVLPDELIVLPGHYSDWRRESNEDYLILNDFGTVKKLNEDIYGIEGEDEFVEYMKENMREQPDIYNQIRKVNAGALSLREEEQDIMDLGKNECAASSNRGMQHI